MRKEPTAPEKSLGCPSVGRGRTWMVTGADSTVRSASTAEPKKGSSLA